MRHIFITAIAVAIAGPALAGGAVETACQKAGRNASDAMCACIQQAADRTLGGGDQRRAAKFFADPEKAQETRVSDSASADAFWDRYSAFVATAQKMCAPS